jgi:thymidylate synthase
VPFNLFSYAALLRMMCRLVGRESGGMVHVLGDMHVYEGHVGVVKEQLARCPHAPPTLV